MPPCPTNGPYANTPRSANRFRPPATSCGSPPIRSRRPKGSSKSCPWHSGRSTHAAVSSSCSTASAGGRSGPRRTAPRRTRRRKHPAGMEHLARGASAGRKARRPRRDAHSAQCCQLHHTRQTLAAQRAGPFDALFQRTDQRAGFQLRDDLRRRLHHPARPLQHGLEQMELSGREHQNRAGAPQRAGEQAARQRTAPRRGRPGRAAALGDRPLRAGQQGQCADP